MASRDIVQSSAALVVPCYNEAGRLRLGDFEAFLSAPQTRAVLVFVNDGSRDNTLDILQRLRSAYPDRAQVLNMPQNSGKAEAVRTGICHCLSQDFTFAGFWDADLATPLHAAGDFLALLDAEPRLDMVFGSRVKLLGRRVERKPARHYIGRFFATAVSAVLALPVYDTQCGAKVFRLTPQIRSVFREPFLSRWIFDVEIIARYIQAVGSSASAAERIFEFPLHEWKDISGSKLATFDFVKAAYDLLRIQRTYRIR
jgi:glycosyltransferase involved in cell wall biosynthesis